MGNLEKSWEKSPNQYGEYAEFLGLRTKLRNLNNRRNSAHEVPLSRILVGIIEGKLGIIFDNEGDILALEVEVKKSSEIYKMALEINLLIH